MPQDLHLTLAFIGELDAPRARRVAAMLAALDVPAFDWAIDHSGSFAAAGVVWAGGAPDPRLDALAQAVRRGLALLGVPCDARPFRPHVTLLRGRAPPQDTACALAPPVRWPVTRPLLARSRPTGGAAAARYRPWRFAAAP